VKDPPPRGAAIGRLVQPGADDDAVDLQDDESDAVARSVYDEDDLSAEEEAVHLTGDPPLGALGDGYLG
jgi:hypothetical protein